MCARVCVLSHDGVCVRVVVWRLHLHCSSGYLAVDAIAVVCLSIRSGGSCYESAVFCSCLPPFPGASLVLSRALCPAFVALFSTHIREKRVDACIVCYYTMMFLLRRIVT